MNDIQAHAASRCRPKPDGVVTRGTTHPNRLRRVDRWIGYALGRELRTNEGSVVVDLGYGRSPVTTLEWSNRLRSAYGPRIEVVGVEIDRDRVRDAAPYAREGLSFQHGGFEVPLVNGAAPRVVRALNVLRQYAESDVRGVWTKVVHRLTDDGAFIEGTCDELGRRCVWVTLHAADARMSGVVQPRTLTFSAHVSHLGVPSDLAERLPKALIHHNVDGEAVHEFFRVWDRAWAKAAPAGTFGARQRWIEAAHTMCDSGLPIAGGPSRWRLGELTVAWSAVAAN